MRYKSSVVSGQGPGASGQGFRARREDAAAKRPYRLPPTTYHLPPTAYRLPLRGVTLIEMLIVVAIIAILAVAGARTMQPAIEGRRIREAARAVNVYLGVARNHALATGRPCGVMIRRFPNLPQCSMVLEQVEQPAPYAGNTIDATATLQINPPNSNTVVANLPSDFSSGLVHDGDLVQFNHQGPFYKVATGGVAATALTLLVDLSQGQILPWPSGSPSDPVPYKIFRSPTKTAVGPLQLPTGTVIDLAASGVGNTTNFTPTGGMSVRIMFSPNGSVDKVYRDGGPENVTDPIFLLIGKRENILDTSNPNWSDFTNLWIAINPQTGLVTTAEVAPQDPTDGSTADDFEDSRDFARQAQSMGGR